MHVESTLSVPKYLVHTNVIALKDTILAIGNETASVSKTSSTRMTQIFSISMFKLNFIRFQAGIMFVSTNPFEGLDQWNTEC